MTEATIREISLRQSYLTDKNLKSIYFGGGTPSVLSASELEGIFAELAQHFSWDAKAEITLEANPDDINPESLRLWKNVGINRLSIGLQSFNDEELKWMNRAHTAAESLRSVKLAQDSGFDNISIDLIYGSKFQTLQSWGKTLATAVGLDTQHISSYNLTIEDKTALGLRYQKGAEPGVDDRLSSLQFLMMLDKLENAGFVGYEISNFGKPGRFAVHNTSYWLQQPYLGLGPSAHSFDGESRQWNVKNNNLYIKALNENLPFFEKEVLTTADRYNEYILTRLRTIWGCDLREVAEKFGNDYAARLRSGAESIGPELIEIENELITLTREGKLRADGLSAELFV